MNDDARRPLAVTGPVREARLRSEERRVYAVLVVLALIALFALSREHWSNVGGAVDPRLPRAGLTAVGFLALVQVAILLVVRWARRSGGAIPLWFAVATVVVEALVPGVLLLLQVLYRSIPPQVALGAPPILAYGILMALTTLRLVPLYCLVAGGVAAGSYVVLLVVAERVAGPGANSLPRGIYVSFPVLLAINGLATAWVAHELRQLFGIAQREAETRRQMDRVEADLAVARAIQQALLPRSRPEIAGFDIAGWNRPADQTGGDYYDWQELPDGRWIVSLADVSGHGIGPALVTAACRAYMRASSQYDGDLCSIASRMNRLLAHDLPEGRFVTMASILIDPRGGPLALLSAGHGPSFLWLHASGSVEELVPDDLPLAVLSDATFGPARSVELRPGDMLVLVTDGFFEWAKASPAGGRDHERFGLDRLRASLASHADKPPAALIEAVAADVAAFAGGEPPQDDLTMVVVRRAG